jgi:AraC-like DNA-binding protein
MMRFVTIEDVESSHRQVWLWPGYAAYFGPSFHLDTHSTPVHCFALGVDAPFTVQIPGGASALARSALIPARTVHRIRSGPGRMLFYYLDPSSTRVGSVDAAMTGRSEPIATGHRGEVALCGYLSGAGPVDPAELRRIIVGNNDAESIDPRIRLTMDRMLAAPAESMSAADMAAELGLSTSRFLHLFTGNAGTSFRRYRLWTRLLYVGAAVSRGDDFTTAAVDAGFASPSHFSDTFRVMFGLTASSVLSQNSEITTLSA